MPFFAACCGPRQPPRGHPENQCRATAPAPAPPPAPYYVYVTNEQGGDLTVIHGGTNEVVATIPLGKRPRGVKVSPDGTQLFVALSGSPIAGPGVDESKLPPADKSADGIGIVDIATRKVVKMLHGGSDPESLSLSADGTRVYASNEDAGGASIIDVATDKILMTIPVGEEPEGVMTSPDGKFVYVTSEGDGQVTAIDTATNKAVKTFKVDARPRACAFLPDSPRLLHHGERRDGVGHRREKTHDHQGDKGARGGGEAHGACRGSRRKARLHHHRPRRHAGGAGYGHERVRGVGEGGRAAVGRGYQPGRQAPLYGQRTVGRHLGG